MNRQRIIRILTDGGIIFLAISLLLISAPRSWSLFPLGLFLGAGLGLWITDFTNVKTKLAADWRLSLPPVLYFIIHLFSILFQGGGIFLLENRLMFLLLPIFGMPLFCSDLFGQRVIIILKAFISGIFIVCIFIFIRAIYLTINDYNFEVTFLQNIKGNKEIFFFTNLSILEHPSYLAMKINWVIIILTWFKSRIIKNRLLRIIIISLLSLVIFLIASKSGIVIWLFIMVALIIINIRNNPYKFLLYILTIPFFLVLSYRIIVDIDRVGAFLNSMKTGLNKENIDWKNLDQRTREWYSSIQLIKENPITGIGLANVEERMVAEYLKHGWEEEALYRFNAHNQFLEAQMTFGIAGTLSLIWMLLTPLIVRKRSGFPHLTTVFVFLISFLLMFESMFNRQWGIMFFMIFYFVLTKWTIAPDQPQ